MMNNEEPKLEYMSRTFLTDLYHTDWENQWVSVRVQAPHRYFDDREYYVSGQLDISDGSHTASFYVSFTTKEEVDKTVESLNILASNLNAFIDKLKQSGEKLLELNSTTTNNV